MLNENHFFFVSSEHEAAMVKYSRLPKKRENEKVNIDVMNLQADMLYESH